MAALRGTPTEDSTGAYPTTETETPTVANTTHASDAIAADDGGDSSSGNALTRENFSEVVMDTFFTAMTLDDR